MRRMSKNPEPPLRALSIILGTAIGCVFSYAFQTNLPTLLHEPKSPFLGGIWMSLIIFAGIPVLAGFVGGLLQPALAMKNSLYIGFFSGVFNSILATLKMIYSTSVTLNEVYGFCVFTVISIFIWMILAAAGGALAEKFYE